MADLVRERSRSPDLNRLHLKTPRRRRVKCTPDDPAFYGRSSQSQGGVSAHGIDIEPDWNVLDGMIKDGDNWLGRARALEEQPPENQSPFRQNPIPGLGRSQIWFKFDEDSEATQDYKLKAQGLATPLGDPLATVYPAYNRPPKDFKEQGCQGAPGCVSQSPPALFDSSRTTSGASTRTTAGGQLASIDSPGADACPNTSVVLPIQVGSEKWYTEGAARKVLQTWAYRNAHIIGRYRTKPGASTNKKNRARAWLANLPAHRLQKYLNTAMPDIDTITYKVGTPPEPKNATKQTTEWDGRSRFCLLTFQNQGPQLLLDLALV